VIVKDREHADSTNVGKTMNLIYIEMEKISAAHREIERKEKSRSRSTTVREMKT
jgi:hypothetical protein